MDAAHREERAQSFGAEAEDFEGPTFEAMVKYAFTANIAAQLNGKNLTNRYYYDQLHFFHVVPGEGRTALLSLSVRF